MAPNPKCPYCGERQTRDEAIPSKPRVISGGWRLPRITVYDDHCRSCGKRIIWGFQYGNGTIGQIATAPVVYSWSVPFGLYPKTPKGR